MLLHAGKSCRQENSRRIREKIEPDPEDPRYLMTVRGAGYRFEVPR